MNPDYSVSQSSNVVPPRIVKNLTSVQGGTPAPIGQVVALTIDATSRGYDISQLLWQGQKQGNAGDVDAFYLSFQAESNDVYFLFDSDAAGTNSIDDSLAIAAGTALSLTTGTSFPPAKIIAGLPPVDVRIERAVDKTLIVKCASGKSAILRFWPSSQRMPGAT